MIGLLKEGGVSWREWPPFQILLPTIVCLGLSLLTSDPAIGHRQIGNGSPKHIINFSALQSGTAGCTLPFVDIEICVAL